MVMMAMMALVQSPSPLCDGSGSSIVKVVVHERGCGQPA